MITLQSKGVDLVYIAADVIGSDEKLTDLQMYERLETDISFEDFVHISMPLRTEMYLVNIGVLDIDTLNKSLEQFRDLGLKMINKG